MVKFKIAIAGCGSMANAWVQYALSRSDCHIVAFVDIKRENAEAMAQKHNLDCKVFTDITEAIKATGANLVFDVTIPESHKDIVMKSLVLGCDVLGEKPMAASMEEAFEMLNAVRETVRNYAVMQNRRYLKEIRSLKEIVVSGVLGEIGFVGADFFLGPHFGGFRDIMDSPLILDMAIHTFDQARFITGKDPVSVYCHEFNPPGSWYKGNAAAICIFEMTDGTVFCYQGSWCSEGVPTSWEASWRVSGSIGTAMWDGKNPPYYELVSVPGGHGGLCSEFNRYEPAPNWGGNGGHQGCLDEMFFALLDGRKAETDCEDNIKSMAMVFAAIKSAKTGQKVKIEY